MPYVDDWSKVISTHTEVEVPPLTFNDLRKAIQEVKTVAGYCCQYAYYGYTCKCAYKRAQELQLRQYYYGIDTSTSTNKKEKKMSVVDKLKRLAMDKDDRLLVDYKIVDESGELTCEGQEVLWTVLLEKYKPELVAKVRELDEEEKSKKKSKK